MSDAKLPGFAEREVRARGTRLRYFVAGEGPPIVLIHGLGGLALNWSLVAPALARRRRVLVPDLPGHGGSSGLPGATTLGPYAEAVRAAAAHEGMLPAPLVGHSLGAVVALRLAIRRPAEVSAIVLAGAAGISSSTPAAVRTLALFGALRPSRLASPFRQRIAASPWLRRAAFSWWFVSDPVALTPAAAVCFLVGGNVNSDFATAWRALVRDDPRTDLDRVRCPCFVLWGARDNQLRVSDAFDFARRLHAPVRLIPDCGHLLIGERPDACIDAIEAFLDPLDTAPAAPAAD